VLVHPDRRTAALRRNGRRQGGRRALQQSRSARVARTPDRRAPPCRPCPEKWIRGFSLLCRRGHRRAPYTRDTAVGRHPCDHLHCRPRRLLRLLPRQLAGGSFADLAGRLPRLPDDIPAWSLDVAGALAGLKVLELGTLIAGPFAARMFAEFGADVIKVEDPRGGDPSTNCGYL